MTAASRLREMGKTRRARAAWVAVPASCLAVLGLSHGSSAGPAPASRFQFEDVAPKAGLTRVTAFGRPGKDHLLDSAGAGIAFLDYDRHGRLDVYVANDSDPNYLYRNEGNGVFKEVATWAGCALDGNGAAQASMGLATGDVDGDGILDLFTTNFSEDFSTLYHGVGNDPFEDVSRASGVGPATFRYLKWGAALADLDNDGDLDLLQADGHIYPQIDRHPEIIGTFAQKSLLAGRQLRIRKGT